MVSDLVQLTHLLKQATYQILNSPLVHVTIWRACTVTIRSAILLPLFAHFDSTPNHGISGGIHQAFEIYPSLLCRQLDNCLVRPISYWTFSEMIAELDQQGADTDYRILEGIPAGASLAGKLFENKVHKIFRSITEPRRLTIFSLENRSVNFEIEFSSGMKCCSLELPNIFLATGVNVVNEPVNDGYLRFSRLSRVFPTFDSFLYQHGMLRAGHPSLMGLLERCQFKNYYDHNVHTFVFVTMISGSTLF